MNDVGTGYSIINIKGLHDFLNLARELWRPSLGVGLYCALTMFAIQYPIYAPSWITQTLPQNMPLSLVPTTAYGLTFLVVALLYAKWKLVFRGQNYLRAIAGLSSLGILATLITVIIGPTHLYVAMALTLSGSTVTAITTALLGIEWMRALATRGTLKTFVAMSLGSFAVAAIFFALGVLPTTFVLCVAILFPLISTRLLDYPKSKQAKLFRHGAKSKVSIPGKLAFTILIQGLSAGVVQRALDGQATLTYLEVEALGIILASLIAICAVMALKFDFNQLLYTLGFPLMALGYAILAAFGMHAGAGCLLHETGSRFIVLMNWTLSAWIIRQQDLSANWVYPCVMCSYLIGRQIGVVAGSFASLSANLTCSIMIFILLMCSVVMLSNRKKTSGWGAFCISDEKPVIANEFNEVCSLIAKNFGLTPRESEIFDLLAKGRNRKYLCDNLMISTDTAKSHMRNIYQKLGIHSQQELVSLVENVESNTSETSTPASIPRQLR